MRIIWMIKWIELTFLMTILHYILQNIKVNKNFINQVDAWHVYAKPHEKHLCMKYLLFITCFIHSF